MYTGCPCRRKTRWEGYILSSRDIKDLTGLSGQTQTHKYRAEQLKHSTARTHISASFSSSGPPQQENYHHCYRKGKMQLYDPFFYFYWLFQLSFLFLYLPWNLVQIRQNLNLSNILILGLGPTALAAKIKPGELWLPLHWQTLAFSQSVIFYTAYP